MKLHYTEFNQYFSWQQMWFSCCCDSLGILLLAPVTEVGPEPHSTTAAATYTGLPLPEGLCLLFI